MSRVLVVEDTLSELELISNFLKESGYEVIIATHAKEALNKVTEHHPDAIVTDVVMPDMSGFELCRQLKRDDATKKLPIIICSSKNSEIDKIWGMRQGADVYLTKPFTKEQLVRAVRTVVD